MKIVVLAGGYSPEREVSLSSGSLIANALMEKGHRVLLLDVYEGMNELPEDPETLFRSSGNYEHVIRKTVPDLAALRRRVGNGNALIGKNVLELCRIADIAFLALHGAMGENGQMQAVLDSFGIPYTGSGYAGSVLAMEKELAKTIFRSVGIPTPDGILFDAKHDSIERILCEVGLPCVIKPCNCGSSVGVSIVENADELEKAVSVAAKYGVRMLAEKKITGRELTMGILDGRALPPVEIIPQKGFYDYKNKYQGNTLEVCPAEIPSDVTARMEDYTKRGFEALDLNGYARFDFLLDQNGELWCLEANTLPGMTPISLLPQEARAVGISYPDLCETILQLGMKKFS